MRFCLRVTLPLEATDTNICKIAVDKATQVAACTALDVTIDGIEKPRSAYFWGMLNFMTCDNTMLIVHSEPYNIVPMMLAKYFDVGKNGSGSYVGNKLSNIRLSGNRIKAMGTPSILNANVNANMPLEMAQRLDEMNVAYLVTISDASANDIALVRSTGIQGFPVNAYTIGNLLIITQVRMQQTGLQHLKQELTQCLEMSRHITRFKQFLLGIFRSLLRLLLDSNRLELFPSLMSCRKKKQLCYKQTNTLMI